MLNVHLHNIQKILNHIYNYIFIILGEPGYPGSKGDKGDRGYPGKYSNYILIQYKNIDT